MVPVPPARVHLPLSSRPGCEGGRRGRGVPLIPHAAHPCRPPSRSPASPGRRRRPRTSPADPRVHPCPRSRRSPAGSPRPASPLPATFFALAPAAAAAAAPSPASQRGARAKPDPRGGWRGRGMERAPDVSAGNKGSGNKRREEKCLRGFSFIPAPCALNSNLLIPNRCRVLHDLIISGFLFLPGRLSVSFASLSHIVQLLAWVRYCWGFF